MTTIINYRNYGSFFVRCLPSLSAGLARIKTITINYAIMKQGIKFLVWVLILPSIMVSCSGDSETATPSKPTTPPPEDIRVDTFTFSSHGMDTTAIIYVPDSFDTNSELPAIYLLDFQEQHYTPATDEFEQVVNAVREIQNFDALVVTLEGLYDIDAVPSDYQEYAGVFKDMIAYVESNYTGNTSSTFIARGSEAGVVLLTLMNEDPDANLFDNYIATDSPPSFNSVVVSIHQNGNIPENLPNKKLHFSYSSSNNSSSCGELINSFLEPQYPWLTFKSKSFSNGIYTNIYPEAFEAGIRFVFDQ